MISKNLKKLAADSNVLLSAVIGKSALKIFTLSHIEIITTHFNIEEVKEYIPRLASKYGLDQNSLLLQLNMLPLAQYPQTYYQSHMLEAKKHLEHRDADDIHLGALALKEHIPVWSHDKDFEHFPLPVVGTAQLLKILDL